MQTWGNLDLAKIRHPEERIVVFRSVVANAALVAAVVALVYLAPTWVTGRAGVSALIERVRLAAIAVIVLLPLLSLMRSGHWAEIRENSVRLGRDQVPELFAILERHCRVLGVEPPELYVSTLERVGISSALALIWGRRRVIVLGQNLFNGVDRIRDRTDVLEFVLGHELGRLALGHAGWREEVLLGYLKRIPVLRMPLLTVQTASRDRFAATLSPGGIRGLVLIAVGGELLDHVDTAAFVRQVMRDDTPERWAWVGKLGRDGPHLAERVRALYRAGFLDLERDLGLTSAPPAAPGGAVGAAAATSRPEREPPRPPT